VEGFASDYVIRARAAEFKNGGYERAFINRRPGKEEAAAAATT
jgi:hypothetical protein